MFGPETTDINAPNQMYLIHRSKLEHDGIRFGPFTDQIIKLIN
jgi:hypothetical protein